MKVVLATPTVERPHDAYLAALEASIPALDAAGFDHGATFEVGNPYISAARSTMLRKAMDAEADVVVFIDHDVSWNPADLVRLIETDGDVVAGTYRFKHDEPEEYMGLLEGEFPIVREDGCVKARFVPAGFLKVTMAGVDRFMRAYPHLVYGDSDKPSVDLFNHGAIGGVWYGEDYAFSKRWNERCGDIWLIPDLDIDHHSKSRVWPGNFHKFLLRQPGGSEAPHAIQHL